MTPRMKIEIITLFPAYFDSVVNQSIIGRGREKRLFDIEIINLRDFTTDRHNTADDKPFGGGGGMVLMVEPLDRCLGALGYSAGVNEDEKIVLTSAGGRLFDQPQAVEYSLLNRLTVICGHYLGVDERLLELYEIEEVSIGDYVLTGGEPAAAVMLDAVVRLIPGVLGNFESALADSHVEKILGAPVYTRPEEYKGVNVPETLLGGNHKEIENFRRREALKKTYFKRPELLDGIELPKDEMEFLDKLKESENNENE